MSTTRRSRLSRRRLLKQGALAASAGAALLTGAAAEGQAAQAPAVVTKRRFRGWVSRGDGRGRTTLQELTLRPISGRQILIRTEATNLCYSNVGVVLGIQPTVTAPPSALAPPPGARRMNDMAVIQGHGGIGVVEAVGPEVRRVRVGDRVCLSGTPQCGSCYQCLRGRSDMCQFLSAIGADDLVPMADMRDGTPVYENSHIGGLAELMVTFEEWAVPIFTKADAVPLDMVCSCVSVAGLGATTSQALTIVAPGSTVAVVGCGPLGLSAVQGARIAGATRIIAIDPIRARREVALKIGATDVLDPNAEGDHLVDRVRALSTWPTDRLWSGGRNPGGRRPGAGPDVVIEAAGADWITPKTEASPDPSGVKGVEDAYHMCALGGHVITTSLVRGTISLPGTLFTIGGVTHHAGQAGGMSPMRDIPRFIEFLEKGQYDAASLATTVVPLERMLEGYEQVASRSTITAIMTA
ncbi:MAG TPA: alcohol dehydrogenase catalytic domain-containing protein [Vicinamibacterales bacterium]|nr:alcohol dehydrogenase catalytic domain-containing protein [Vicinamibacterales bacterium]